MRPSPLCCLLAGLLPPAAWAATYDDPVVVTATRIPRPALAVGGAVDVIELDDWLGPKTSLADVLRGRPGVGVSRSGGPGQLTQARLRGAEANHVLVLLDGVELTNPATGTVDFAHLSAAGIERVEILRGAQSALWGSHAAAGVINLVSRGADGPAAEAALRAGADGLTETSGRLAAGGERGGLAAGWQSFTTRGDNISPTGGEEDGYRSRTVQLNGRWTPAPESELRLSFRRGRGRAEYDGSENGRPIDADHHSRHERTALSAAARARIGRIRWQSTAAYLQTRDRNTDDFGATEADGQRVQLDLLGWREFERCAARGACTLGLGLEWSRERYTRGAVGPLRTRSRSALAIAQWRPLDPIDVDLSLRRDDNDDFGDAGTWRAGAAWRLAGGAARLYAAAGTGIVNPSLTERFGYFPGSFRGNPDLRPERTRDREAGIAFPLGGLRVDASVFAQDLRDEIAGEHDAASGASTTVNRSGRSKRRGLELELRAAPGSAWSWSGGYTYTRSSEPTADGPRREVRRPRHRYRAALEYRAGRWRAALDARAARGLLDQDFASFPARRIALGNHEVADLSARCELDREWTLSLSARNLFDERYQEVLGYRAPDRQLSLELRWRPDY